eukprot:SAG31_NODE_40353_length_281_cov_0.851648_1_plen_22_part_01
MDVHGPSSQQNMQIADHVQAAP